MTLIYKFSLQYRGSHQFCADAAPFLYDFVLEFLILKSIRFEKSEQSVIGDVGQSFGDALRVEFLENLAYLFGGMSTEEERIVRHIEEVFSVVVDNINALIGGLRKGLRRLHIGHRPLVVIFGDTFHTVRLKEGIVFLCHNGLWICGAKEIILWQISFLSFLVKGTL